MLLNTERAPGQGTCEKCNLQCSRLNKNKARNHFFNEVMNTHYIKTFQISNKTSCAENVYL